VDLELDRTAPASRLSTAAVPGSSFSSAADASTTVLLGIGFGAPARNQLFGEKPPGSHVPPDRPLCAANGLGAAGHADFALFEAQNDLVADFDPEGFAERVAWSALQFGRRDPTPITAARGAPYGRGTAGNGPEHWRR
jgi:hypothetical protein